MAVALAAVARNWRRDWMMDMGADSVRGEPVRAYVGHDRTWKGSGAADPLTC
jgi:hypothetical protein